MVFVQLLSCVQLFATPWTAVPQASLSFIILVKLKFIESMIPSNDLLCRTLLLLPSIFPSIRVFSQWVSSSHQLHTGASASASVLPIYIQSWFPLGLIGLISLLSKGLWRVFSSTCGIYVFLNHLTCIKLCYYFYQVPFLKNKVTDNVLSVVSQYHFPQKAYGFYCIILPTTVTFRSLYVALGFPGGSKSTYQCRRLRFNPWLGRFPEERNANPLRYSCLGKSHGQRNLAATPVHGVSRIRHDLESKPPPPYRRENSVLHPISQMFTVHILTDHQDSHNL